ncbi:hypothetical protein M0805_008186 [Coniferiporia weirii]|nr:hypothetical protein M0805_008186 [Coniferiporia weirii]
MTEYGFLGCIGIVDGTLIPLANKPHVNGELYWCCKKFYMLTIQAICDHNLCFTQFEMGWPGNIQDTTVFRESDVWLKKVKYFEDNEYILADKGYLLTKFTIQPFTASDLTNNPEEARMLKGCFPALRSLFSNKLHIMYCLIEALMVVHNILQDLGNDPMEIDSYNGEVGQDLFTGEGDNCNANVQCATQINNMSDCMLYRTGLYRRKQLLNLMYE